MAHNKLHRGQRGRFELCEKRHCLSAVAFVAHEIATDVTTQRRSVEMVDLDGDNDMDLLSRGHGLITWKPNTDGRGDFGPEQVIAAANGNSVGAADLDNDGDVDVFSWGTTITWYENIDGQGNFGQERLITSSVMQVRSVTAADLDQDGDLDVLSASFADGKIGWFENTDGQGNFGDQQIISEVADGASSIDAADLDGDGDLDVLSASRGDRNIPNSDDKIVWYENTDSQGSFGREQVITTDLYYAISVKTADLDGDGDQDVISSTKGDGDAVVHQNVDGAGTFRIWKELSINSGGVDLDRVGRPQIADLDSDGDPDILLTGRGNSESVFGWFENTDGRGAFRKHVITRVPFARDYSTGDIDGDGSLDLLFVRDGGRIVSWRKNNLDREGNFGPDQVIAFPMSMTSIALGDLDGDTDFDLLFAAPHEFSDVEGVVIGWYKNIDGQGTIRQPEIISVDYSHEGIERLTTVDFDRDGDLDIFVSHEGQSGWFENTDGRGNFGLEQRIGSTDEVGHTVDVDGDGDLDVLASDYNWDCRCDKIVWYENSDGLGTFRPEPFAIDTEQGISTFVPADFDSDGDVDLLAGDGPITWYQNTDGGGNLVRQQVLDTDTAPRSRISTADIDSDGDIDVLTWNDDVFVWYENTDGKGTFGQKKLKLTLSENVFPLTTPDIDGDGDIDLLYQDNQRTVWRENLDGEGHFGSELPITENGRRMAVADLDGDGHLDVVTALRPDSDRRSSDQILWHEQILIGDVNHDDTFDSSDLTKVFQAGKYEDGIPDNATFDEGDWNQDGDFDSSDLVLAFQAGHYEASAEPLAAEIAAAVDSVFADKEADSLTRLTFVA